MTKPEREAAAVKAAVRLMGQEGPEGESVWEALVRIAGERDWEREKRDALEDLYAEAKAERDAAQAQREQDRRDLEQCRLQVAWEKWQVWEARHRPDQTP